MNQAGQRRPLRRILSKADADRRASIVTDCQAAGGGDRGGSRVVRQGPESSFSLQAWLQFVV